MCNSLITLFIVPLSYCIIIGVFVMSGPLESWWQYIGVLYFTHVVHALFSFCICSRPVKHSSTCVHELLSLLPFSVGIHSFVDLNVPVFLGQYHTLLFMLVTLLLHIE